MHNISRAGFIRRLIGSLVGLTVIPQVAEATNAVAEAVPAAPVTQTTQQLIDDSPPVDLLQHIRFMWRFDDGWRIELQHSADGATWEHYGWLTDPSYLEDGVLPAGTILWVNDAPVGELLPR